MCVNGWYRRMGLQGLRAVCGWSSVRDIRAGGGMVTNDYSSSLSLSTGRTLLGKTASPGGGKQKRSHCEGEAVRHFLLWEEIHRNVLPAPMSPTPSHEGPGSQTVTDLVSSNRFAIWFVFLHTAVLIIPLMHDQWFVHSLGCWQTNTY